VEALSDGRRRYDYLKARDAMFAATSSDSAPWHIVDNDDKKRGRLNIISHLLTQIPYTPVPKSNGKMPPPPSAGGYSEPESSRGNIPTPF
jgi:polyphosphate kinase